MNQHYNFKEAGDTLERIATESYGGRGKAKYLSAFNAEDGIHTTCTIMRQGEGSVYCLVTNHRDDESVEVVLRLQGILTQHQLPPILWMPRRSDSVKQMRQGVTLTGLGTHKFKAALESVLAIHAMFNKQVTAGKLRSWTPGVFQSYRTAGIWTRYFSQPREAMAMPAVPFSSAVDPHGILASLSKGNLLHTSDNEVSYFQRMRKSEREGYNYVPLNPSKFSCGDIVEAQLSFKMIPGIKGDFRMLLVLRSLALLDDSFSKASESAERQAAVENLQPSGIKRKVLYSDDEEDNDQNKDQEDGEKEVNESRRAMVNLSMNENDHMIS